MTDSNPVRHREKMLSLAAAAAVCGGLLPSSLADWPAAKPGAGESASPGPPGVSASQKVRRTRRSLGKRSGSGSRRAGTSGMIARFLRRYGAILAFFGIWQLGAQLRLVDRSVVPPFSAVIAALVHGFAGGELGDNMLVSLARSGAAFAIAVTLAIPLGLFMGSFARFERAIDPLIQLFRQTSALAIYPIFILWLGLGETSKITIICWAAFFPVLLNTISGVKQVDARLIEMARVFGASKAEVFRRVVLPGATPSIFVGLRLGATTALLLLVAAEMIGAKQGLGFLIINSQYNFEIPLMFAAIVLLASIGLTVNYTLQLLQQRLCRWENSGKAQRTGRHRNTLARLDLTANKTRQPPIG
jgi:sulfonate transport system permease protein